MPCICGCTKCKDFFHLDCVNILPSDVEFLLNNRFCFGSSCAAIRRKSIRSPPRPIVLDESVKQDFTGKEFDNNNLPTENSFAEQQQTTLRFMVNEIAAFRTDNAHTYVRCDQCTE